jgi:ribonucleoside-diphosphate reductase alpha chain
MDEFKKTNQPGPVTENARWLHELKYRTCGEDFSESMTRIADTLTATPDDFRKLRAILLDQSFLPAGRIQSAIGTGRAGATAHNCFVSQTIEDNSESIMQSVANAFQTLRTGGGIGYNFSNLRPEGARIKSIGSVSSGPVSFMHIYDSVCKTVSAAGHRRGAQMGCIDVSHPDIWKFIHAKTGGNQETLSAFNLSVFVSDDFMRAVEDDGVFDLHFEGVAYDTIKARKLYDAIMRSTWDWAEPGLLFGDTINKRNNLWYCEKLAATNPCGEQPLPSHGACLLGSMNIVKYVRPPLSSEDSNYIDYTSLAADVGVAVRALDAVMEESNYPLEEQRLEAINKRRIGLGVTGVASALTAIAGCEVYGSPAYIKEQNKILETIRDNAYLTSIELAKEFGAFPLFDSEKYLSVAQGTFASTLPAAIQKLIRKHGIRNSHLTSIAPTGTISMCADNVSSGIEPVFSVETTRTIQTEDGPTTVQIVDYALLKWGLRAQEASAVTAEQHLLVLANAQRFVDSAVSKTCNVSPDMPWEDFKALYLKAWHLGCKGITTFNSGGKRFGMMAPTLADDSVPRKVSLRDEGATCYVDLETGQKDCGE